MNEQKHTDFFPAASERNAPLVATEIYEPYRKTEEDRVQEERLKEFEAELDEKLGAASSSSSADDELGELPYDAEADRKRWEELEKDFDRVFDQAEKNNS
jgi:hypothetical protein